MLQKSISKLALAVGLVLVPVSAFAGDNHPHDKGPHGGTVTGFGKYHLEGVRSGDTASFYLLGDDGKTPATMAKSNGGTFTVLAGTAQTKADIAPGSFSEATTKVPATGKVTVLVAIKDEAKSVSAKFNFADK